MAHKLMPYLLPIATLFIVSSLFIFARPQITGFFIAQPKSTINAEIRITAEEVLPEDAMVVITVLDELKQPILSIEEIAIKEFVEKYSLPLEYTEGTNSQLNYKGKGYIGSSKIDISSIEITKILKGTFFVRVEIIYNGITASVSEQELKI